MFFFFLNTLMNSDGSYALDVNQDKIPEPEHTVCKLWNASYHVGFSFENGAQISMKLDPDLVCGVHRLSPQPWLVKRCKISTIEENSRRPTRASTKC